MQIVIDIPEELYEANNRGLEAEEVWDLRMAVKNGIPIPKNHGRLIDADDLEHITICSKTRNSGITRIEAPTIIEADTESEVEK